jgi:DNA-binding response OmpR family regulator
MGANGDTILLIERAGRPEHTFAAALRQKGFEILLVATGQSALKKARELRPSIIVLNSASMNSSGLRICHQLREVANNSPIIHVVGAGVVVDPKQGVGEVTLTLPFTPRKLINTVKRLMPSARHDMIEAGSIRLALRARIVEAYGRETRLTARTANLLNLFMKHPNEVLDRSYLMQNVWHTDYMGDTRTLDVHVRWAREAIERDPQRPKHILTMRRQGYRFVP